MNAEFDDLDSYILSVEANTRLSKLISVTGGSSSQSNVWQNILLIPK